MTTDLGEINKLEQENTKLKRAMGELGEAGRKALRGLRSITLTHENKALREMLAALPLKKYDQL